MLEVTVWDVQHGSAAYIKTPNNRHIAVDLGDTEDFSPLSTLQVRGIQQLDAVVITHPHRDHMDDIFNLGLLSPKTLWTPRHLAEAEIRKGNRAIDAEVVTRYLAVRQEYSLPFAPADDLTAPTNYGGATFQVFVPRFCDQGNLNNHSLVVSYAGLKMVIPGDNESPSWNKLLLNPYFVAAVKGADVLLAAHHGREAGYSSEFFAAMGKPKLVVVSDGRFGDTSATDRYSSQTSGWAVYDAEGQKEDRKCLTTRSDGHITIRLGWCDASNPSRGNFLNVTTSKVDKDSRTALVKAVLGDGY